eukprot:scaffold18630_cov18-Prasinocladus_malaysianus.AAC.1
MNCCKPSSNSDYTCEDDPMRKAIAPTLYCPVNFCNLVPISQENDDQDHRQAGTSGVRWYPETNREDGEVGKILAHQFDYLNYIFGSALARDGRCFGFYRTAALTYYGDCFMIHPDQNRRNVSRRSRDFAPCQLPGSSRLSHISFRVLSSNAAPVPYALSDRLHL